MTPYCTIDDLQKRLSIEAVELRIDDNLEAVNVCIEDASVEIDRYCLLKYDAIVLAASRWIKKKCVDIATMFLCERRANQAPNSVVRAYEQAIEDLKEIHLGTSRLPDAPGRKSAVPVLSQPRTRLNPYPRTVIDQSRSTGTAEGYDQHTDKSTLYFYDI